MTLDDAVTDLQAAKLAFAKEHNIEPCTNETCGFSGCTCGKKCGCNIPACSTVVLETCDPCKDFKKKMGAEKKCSAREA